MLEASIIFELIKRNVGLLNLTGANPPQIFF